MKNINNDIKNQTFKKAYLLYGDEGFLVRMYKKRLKDAISGDDTMNFSEYNGKDIDINDLGDTSRTLPFFAARRLILIENSEFFKKSSDAVCDIVKNAPETTFFIFAETEADKRNKLYKTVNECGYVCEMKTQTDDSLLTWAYRFFKDDNLEIAKKNLTYFIEKTGPDMNNIYNEAMKLTAYCKDKGTVSADDVDKVCITQTEDRIFDMINAMASQNTDEVIRLYKDLLALKEAPMKILALIGRQFSQLFGVKSMLESGHNSQSIATGLGIRPFFVGRYIAQAKNFPLKRIREAVEDCVKMESMVKTGKIEDSYAVELMIVKYSS